MEFNLKINGKKYKIEVSPQEGGKVEIRVGEENYVFHTQSGERKREISVAQTSLPRRNFSKKEILAPIGGIISKVFIKEQQNVKKGEKIVLLSAMKMENEIVSEFNGKVKKILAKEDQRVQEGELLAVLE